MYYNYEIKLINSFGILLDEGIVLTEYNSKIIIDYKSIKKIQLLKKKKGILNAFVFFISFLVLIGSVFMYFRTQYAWYYLISTILSLLILLSPFFFTKYEYVFILNRNNHKIPIKFNVDLNHKEDAKTLVKEVVSVLDHLDRDNSN